MSETVTSMSMIKQVLQLHKGGSSNRLISMKIRLGQGNGQYLCSHR